MKKKKIEVLLKVILDDSTNVTKASFKDYLESVIKGLKVNSVDSFDDTKDLIKAEVTSNVDTLLGVKDLTTQKIIQEEGGIDKLLKNIRSTILLCKDKSKEKKSLKNLEKETLELSQYIKDLERKLNIDEHKAESKNKSLAEEKTKQLLKKITTLESNVSQLSSNLIFKEELNKQLSNDLVRTIEAKLALEKELHEFKHTPVRRASEPLHPNFSGLLSNSHSDNFTEKSFERKSLNESSEELKDQLAELKEDVRIKDIKLTYMTILLSMKEEEVVKSLYSYKKIQSELKKAREEVRIAQLDVTAIGDKGRILQEMLTEADTQISQYKAETENLKKRVRECEEIIKKKEEEAKDYRKEIEKRNEILKNNENRYIEYETNKRQLETIIFNLKEQVTKLNKENSNRSVSERKPNDLIESNTKYEDKISSFENLIREKNNEILLLKSEYNILQISLNEVREDYKKEEELLRLQILKLETQAIDNIPIANDKSAAEFQNEIKQLKKQILELQHLLDNEKIARKLEVEKYEVMVKDKSLAEVDDYVKELIEVHKEMITNSSKNIEEGKAKIQKLKLMDETMMKMADKGMTKEKLQDIITSSLHLFPYLAKLDLKAEFKFIAKCFIKIIEHKLKKMDLYQIEVERNEVALKHSENKLNTYNSLPSTHS